MDRDRFARADALFRAALRVAAEDRGVFVARECGDDDALRSVVMGLLREDAATGGALDRPALGAPMPEARDDATPPTIPGYRIGRAVGSGGMGRVFEAEQESPRRRVALKVMRAAVPSPDSARRFALEGHALARLQHPGIAQVFAAGSCEGPEGIRPYLAMEFVEGEAITIAAARLHLGVRERLDLIAATCDAVQHAHQRGVIHRDLKPANILLVEEDASDAGMRPILRTKVLDFGVARMLDAEGNPETNEASTRAGQLVGTLPYMSPEQASFRPDEVDTRSDVYALGVIAFELLVGRLPYELSRTDPLETARVIRETPPTRLGAIDRRLSGDIETVIGKALEKDRSRRYQTALEFASDLRRHLRGEPIAARPPTVADHLRAIARRHRVATVVAAIAITVVLASLAFALVAWNRAVDDRDDARRQAAIADAISAFLDEDLLGAIDPESSGGAEVTVRETLDRAAAAIGGDRFADEPLVEASLRGSIGRAYRKLGLLAEAEPHLRAAVSLRQGAGEQDGRDAIRAEGDLANLLVLQGREAEAEEAYRSILERKIRLFGEADSSTILAYDNLASLIRRIGRAEEAAPLHERAVALADAHLDADSGVRVRVRVGLASLLRDLGRHDEAGRLYRSALIDARRIHGDASKETLRLLNSLALLEWRRGEVTEAESLLREAIDRHAAQVGLRHPNVLAYRANLGQLLAEIGRGDEARSLLASVVRESEEVLGMEHRGTLIALRSLADAERDGGDSGLAASLYRELIRRWTKRSGPDATGARSAQDALNALEGQRDE